MAREDALVDQIDAAAALERAALSDLERKVMELRAQDLKYSEIAERLGLSTGMIGGIINRARKKLGAVRGAG